MGYASGLQLTSGSSNNIVIGSSAGPATFGVQSNRLFIDIEKSSTPLIYGEFDNNHVVINGTFEVTAGLTNPSSSSLKFNYSKVESTAILDEIMNLDIKEWSYKSYPEQRHIGPIAEEFHESFGLGKDNKSISTIDASGVALVAIQALGVANEETKERFRLLEKNKSLTRKGIEALEEENSYLRNQLQEMTKRIEKLETKANMGTN